MLTTSRLALTASSTRPRSISVALRLVNEAARSGRYRAGFWSSARAVWDAQLLVHVRRVHGDRDRGRGLYGARKVWHQLRRQGIVAARCTVERLMRADGLRGVRRGRQVITTKPDSAAGRAPDLVNRHFRADRPNQLWVVDLTYVPTWSGMVFTAFVWERATPWQPDAAR